jgi:hypothetical protein
MSIVDGIRGGDWQKARELAQRKGTLAPRCARSQKTPNKGDVRIGSAIRSFPVWRKANAIPTGVDEFCEVWLQRFKILAFFPTTRLAR